MERKRRDPTGFAAASGLERRIALTCALLALIYAGFVTGLVLAGTGALLAGVGAAALLAFQLTTADKIALRAAGAHEVSAAGAPELHAAVERLCLVADLPKPRVALSDSTVPNAFTVGTRPGSVLVCVSRGLVDALTPAELEAVLAHELAHIDNRDAVVMTVASFFGIVASYVAQFGARVGHWAFRLAVVAISLGAWAASFLVLRGLSRYRELAADRRAAVITGRPSALASALVKLDARLAGVPDDDMRAVRQLGALSIMPAPMKRLKLRMLATHPTTEQRVAELHRLEVELQRRGRSFEGVIDD